MTITELQKRSQNSHSKKLANRYNKVELLIGELNVREIPHEVVTIINQKVDTINGISDSKMLSKQLRKSYYDILKIIEKELKLVPRNLYRNRWMAIGMSAFGIPMGVAFSSSIDNMSFIGIGIPIGMVIGMAVGSKMDKTAKEEGRQLDFDTTF